MCVSGYISKKIRVGRLVLKKKKSKILFIIFPNFNKKHKCFCLLYVYMYSHKASQKLYEAAPVTDRLKAKDDCVKIKDDS